MMKNKLIALGALSLASVYSLSAQEEVSLTTSIAYEGVYMFRGMKLAEPTYFPSVDVAYGSFYAGLWSALPLDSDEANEVDLYAGYGMELNEMVSLDFGATYYTYPSTESDFFGSGNTLEFYTGFAFDMEYSPAVYVYYDMDKDTLTLEGSAGHSYEFAENTTFDVSLAGGYVVADTDGLEDTLDGDADDYFYAVATAGIGYSINEAASVSVYANYSIATESYFFTDGTVFERGKDEVWFGASVTTGF